MPDQFSSGSLYNQLWRTKGEREHRAKCEKNWNSPREKISQLKLSLVLMKHTRIATTDYKVLTAWKTQGGHSTAGRTEVRGRHWMKDSRRFTPFLKWLESWVKQAHKDPELLKNNQPKPPITSPLLPGLWNPSLGGWLVSVWLHWGLIAKSPNGCLKILQEVGRSQRQLLPTAVYF